MAKTLVDLSTAKSRSDDTLLTVGFNLRRDNTSHSHSLAEATLILSNVSSLQDFEKA